MDGKDDFGEDWSSKCGGVWVSQITRTILNSKGVSYSALIKWEIEESRNGRMESG